MLQLGSDVVDGLLCRLVVAFRSYAAAGSCVLPLNRLCSELRCVLPDPTLYVQVHVLLDICSLYSPLCASVLFNMCSSVLALLHMCSPKKCPLLVVYAHSPDYPRPNKLGPADCLWISPPGNSVALPWVLALALACSPFSGLSNGVFFVTVGPLLPLQKFVLVGPPFYATDDFLL